MTAENVIDTTAEDVEGPYELCPNVEVFLNITFAGNATFELLNHTWEVTSYSEISISLRSTTNTAITLVLSQV